VAPIDGQEYASRRGGAKTQVAEAKVEKGNRVAVRDDHSKAKTAKIAKAAKAAKTAKAAKIAKPAKTVKLARARTM
jgi:hypothetical protein